MNAGLSRAGSSIVLLIYVSLHLSGQVLLQRLTIGEITMIEGGRRAGRAIGRFIIAYQQAKEEMPKYNREFQAARERFWREFPSGPRFAEAEQDFADKLWNKDVYYLSWILPLGARNPLQPFDLADAVNGVQRSIGELDGGIRPAARPAFLEWVEALRTALGARQGEPPIITRDRMERAFEATQTRMKTYLRARDWAEFEASGLDLSKHISPKTYALRLIEKDLAQTGTAIRLERDDPEKAAAQVYQYIVQGVGEKPLLDAAAKVLAAKQDEWGELIAPVGIQFPGSGKETTRRPVDWMNAMLLSSGARGYAVGMIRPGRDLANDWRLAMYNRNRIVDTYGEEAMLAAAERVRAMPKDDRGLVLPDHVAPATVFKKILSPNGVFILDVPTDPVFSVTHVDSLKPRASGTLHGMYYVGMGRTVLRGVVSKIAPELNPARKTEEYILHFAGVPGDQVIARDSFGRSRVWVEDDDRNRTFVAGEDLIGKAVEIRAANLNFNEAGKMLAVFETLRVVPKESIPITPPKITEVPPPPRPAVQFPAGAAPAKASAPPAASKPAPASGNPPYIPKGRVFQAMTDEGLKVENTTPGSTIGAKLLAALPVRGGTLPVGTEVVLKTYRAENGRLMIRAESIRADGNLISIATNSQPMGPAFDASNRQANAKAKAKVREKAKAKGNRNARPLSFNFRIEEEVNP